MADTKTRPTRAQAQGESWAELAKTVVYAGLIAIVIRTFLFQPFNIPSGSMEATLLVGDYLFVEKFSYGYSRYTFPFGGWPFGDTMHGRFMEREPAARRRRGVQDSPQDNSTDFIKRLIGLPGDRIQMIERRALSQRQAGAARARRRLCRDRRRRATHHVAAVSRDAAGRQKLSDARPRSRRRRWTIPSVFVVPAGHYFMMGDNRDNSATTAAPRWAMSRPKIWKARRCSASSPSMAAPHIWEVWKWPLAIRYSRILTVGELTHLSALDDKLGHTFRDPAAAEARADPCQRRCRHAPTSGWNSWATGCWG